MRPFDFTGVMTREPCIEPAATAEPEDLAGWVEAGVGFASALPPK